MNNYFIDLVRFLDKSINENLIQLKDGFSLSLFFVFLLISFVYGFIHSAGPGHGKSLIAAFFLKKKHPLLKAITLSGIISLIHSGTSIILAVFFSTILSGIKGFFRIKIQNYFTITSGVMILIIGLIFLIFKIFKKEKHLDTKNKNTFMIGISAGIVPCPVALVIMLFAISNDIILIGLFSILAISFGMFILLILVGIISIKLRDGLMALSGQFSKKIELISIIVEYLSIVLIILIGLFMFLRFFIK